MIELTKGKKKIVKWNIIWDKTFKFIKMHFKEKNLKKKTKNKYGKRENLVLKIWTFPPTTWINTRIYNSILLLELIPF